MMRCPLCDHETDRPNPVDLVAHVHLTPKERIIAEILARNFGQDVSSERIIGAMYEDDPSGGPDNVVNTYHQYTFRLRKKLEPLGLTIRGYGGTVVRGSVARMSWL